MNEPNNIRSLPRIEYWFKMKSERDIQNYSPSDSDSATPPPEEISKPKLSKKISIESFDETTGWADSIWFIFLDPM